MAAVKENDWDEVANYCCNDVNATEQVFEAWNKQRSSELAAYYNTPQRERNIRKALIEGRKLV